MVKPRIIAICGLKRSGKDTIADTLCTFFEYEKVKIASPLKNALKILFQLTDNQVEGPEKDLIDPKWGIEPRKLLQFIGTEVMQFQLQEILPNVGRTFWIKRLIDEHIDNGSHGHIVIPDLRFKHEYEVLAKHDAVFWRVERFQKGQHNDAHSSEKEYLDIPVNDVIINYGSKTDLESIVIQKMKNLIKTDGHVS
jgi:hypothetical protein